MSRVASLQLAVVALVGLAAASTAIRNGETWLVGEMHENLSAVNKVVEAVARDDFAAIPERAARIRSSAEAIGQVGLEDFGLEAGRRAEFDRYLAAQGRAAGEIRAAARDGDGAAVLAGVQQLYDSACVPCHAEFRETHAERTPPVLFMRTLLESMEEINRGLAMNDYNAIAREAREVSTIASVLSWSQVADVFFRVKNPVDQKTLIEFLRRLSTEASRVESAAFERSPALISASVMRMWEQGCLPCHTRFRARADLPP